MMFTDNVYIEKFLCFVLKHNRNKSDFKAFNLSAVVSSYKVCCEVIVKFFVFAEKIDSGSMNLLCMNLLLMENKIQNVLSNFYVW